MTPAQTRRLLRRIFAKLGVNPGTWHRLLDALRARASAFKISHLAARRRILRAVDALMKRCMAQGHNPAGLFYHHVVEGEVPVPLCAGSEQARFEETRKGRDEEKARQRAARKRKGSPVPWYGGQTQEEKVGRLRSLAEQAKRLLRRERLDG